MIAQLIDYITSVAYKHQYVSKTGYEMLDDINDQHSNKQFEVIIENDSPIINKQKVMGMTTINLSMDIISFVGKRRVIDVQDNATLIAYEIMEYIKNDGYKICEIADYSILSLVQFTDDNSAGARLSLQLIIPEIINLCEWESHFIDKTPEPEQELDLTGEDECTDVKHTSGSTLTLTPIKLR